MGKRRLDIWRSLDGHLDVKILDNYHYSNKVGGWVWDAVYIGSFKEDELIELLMKSEKLVKREGIKEI